MATRPSNSHCLPPLTSSVYPSCTEPGPRLERQLITVAASPVESALMSRRGSRDSSCIKKIKRCSRIIKMAAANPCAQRL